MAQPMPKVRNACEACHKRKQRCLLPEAGGPCHSCRQNARKCFFVPRIRPGKPRRDTLGLDRPGVAASSDSSGAQAQSDTTSPFPSLGADLDNCVQETVRPQLDAAVANLNDNQDDQNDLDSLWDHEFNFALPESGMGISGPLLTPDKQPPSLHRSHEPPALPQASAIASSHFTTPVAALAGHFIELDAQKEILQAQVGSPGRDGNVRSKIESALSVLAEACPQALDMTVEPMNDRDLSRDSIVIGTMMRVFDLCEIILCMIEAQIRPNQPFEAGFFVDQTSQSSGPPSTPTMSHQGHLHHQALPPMTTSHANGTVKLILMLKQLELNLTQARMCSRFLAPSMSPRITSGLTNRCTNLQKRINTMVGGVCT